MVTNKHRIEPLQALREQVTALEAAVTLALADPGKKPVHSLRTATRRIEAQLTLLSLLADPPKLPATFVIRHLKKLRRAAGAVRDLDVGRDLLGDLLKDPGHFQLAAADTSAAGTLPQSARLHRQLERDTKSLRKSLKYRRSSAAGDLVHLLRHRGPAIVVALESLLDHFSSGHEDAALTLPSTRLDTLIRTWYTRQLPTANGMHSADDLHTVRKIAKLARYMAESSPDTSTLAGSFEDLQGAGGTWHDFLQLRTTACRDLGRRSALTQLLDRLTAASLATYQSKLAHPVVQNA